MSTVIPLLNCHREDLPLRQDIVWLMEYLSIDYNNLKYYPEEFDPNRFQDLQVSLVDHNLPDEKLHSHVVEIIDHHDDADAVKCPRTIEKVGSCATLIAERVLQDDSYEVTEEIAILLLAPILADTANLVDDCQRTTDKDRSMVSQLMKFIDRISRTELYNQVMNNL